MPLFAAVVDAEESKSLVPQETDIVAVAAVAEVNDTKLCTLYYEFKLAS